MIFHIRLHRTELNSISDLKQRQRRLVELNVIEQCTNIFKTAVVQRRRMKTFTAQADGSKEYLFTEPRVHAFVYEPTTGKMQKLDVDFKDYLQDLRSVYELYPPVQPPLVPAPPVQPVPEVTRVTLKKRIMNLFQQN